MWNRRPARPVKSPKSIAGAQAEREAENHLRQHGLTLEQRNYRCKSGEIDLIMKDGPACVFVEVRYRKHGRFGSPAETVDHHKQRKLLRAAQHYLQSKRLVDRVPCRFDVVAVTGNTGLPAVDWIRDAF